jgi:PAS domain S-box-containing protein
MEPFAVVVADVTGVIQSWNTAAQRLFGYPAEEIIGRTLVAVFVGQEAEAEGLPSLPEL